MKSLDYTNIKINMLTPIKRIKSKNRRTYWLCKCDCGNEVEVKTQDLTYKTKYSCGCCRKPKKQSPIKYPNKNKKLYAVWFAMKSRCYKINNKKYKYYGGKGIKVCEEWFDDFLCFQDWALNNGYKENLTIDRINNDGNYEPNNCRWITLKENSLRRKGIYQIQYNDKTICLKEFCNINNISYNVARKKIKKGLLI